MSTVSMTSTPDEAPAAPQQEVRLDLSDLQGLLQAVDIAARRGAYGGNEMSQVGGIFDRVARFLQAAMPPAPPSEAVDTQPVAEPPSAPQPTAPLVPPLVTPAVSPIPPFAPKGA